MPSLKLEHLINVIRKTKIGEPYTPYTKGGNCLQKWVVALQICPCRTEPKTGFLLTSS